LTGASRLEAKGCKPQDWREFQQQPWAPESFGDLGVPAYVTLDPWERLHLSVSFYHGCSIEPTRLLLRLTSYHIFGLKSKSFANFLAAIQHLLQPLLHLGRPTIKKFQVLRLVSRKVAKSQGLHMVLLA